MQLKNSCLFLVIIICLSACKAKDLNPLGDFTAAEWDVNGEHFKATSIGQTDGSLDSETPSGGNALHMQLGAKLDATATMKVVGYTTTGMQADELSLWIEHGSNDKYYSTGHDNQTVTVTVTNSKYGITFSNISFRHYTNSTVQSDSITSSGYMKW